MISPVRGDIAIIGMSCLYPGAGSLRQFWENILSKFDAISDAPPDWHPELFYDPATAPDRSYTKRGGFLKELAEFDPIEFGIMPNTVDSSAPDQFLALRTAHEALVDAGYGDLEKLRPWSERTSVILGNGAYISRFHAVVVQRWVAVDAALRVLKQLHPEHTPEELALVREQLLASMPYLNADSLPGLVPNIASGRIANRLNLMGSTFNVDGACASSLLALDIASRELLSGRCDMALAGGVHASNSSPILIIFSQMKGLSLKGQIRPFDSQADGTLLSEGAGFVVLKRREDAERDRDRIYAVIKGMGVSSDGRALGLLAPRPEGEDLAIRRAYEAAGVDPATIELIEGHGTATVAGDATELEVLNRAFGPRVRSLPGCALGSVKSMIGHSIPASGMASIIKMALSLYHKVLPPTINCDHPNPKLQAETSNLYINTETRPWIHASRDTPRRAGVNAFGFGGVNAHAVMEECSAKSPATLLHQRWDSELFVLTAADSEGLVAEAAKLRRFVAEFPAELHLKDLAASLNTKPFGEARLALVALSREDLLAKLEKASIRLAEPGLRRIHDQEGIYYYSQPLAPKGKLAFVFPGEGAQYTNMMVDLALHFPEVREAFDTIDLPFLDHPRGYLASDLLVPPPMHSSAEHLYSMDVGTEAIVCANEAMFRLLTNLGIRPAMMVGHSTGEHSALRCSDVVQLADDREIADSLWRVNEIFEKLRDTNQIPERILLAIGGADHGRLEEMVAASAGRLYMSLDNCPHQVVLCGDQEAIDQALKDLSATSAICQKLPFSRAYHTPWFQIYSERLREYFDSMKMGQPSVPLYSCLTADLMPDDVSKIRDTAAGGWSRTVRFRETIERMYQDGARLFVECGPRGNLKSFIDDILRGKSYLAAASNTQHRSGVLQLHHMLGQLAAHGVPLLLDHLYLRRDPRPVEVPAATRPKTRLRLGIEPMTLPADFKLPSRPQPPPVQLPARLSPPASPAAPMTANGPAPHAPTTFAPPVMAPPQPSPRAAAMEGYLATMQQFLQVQQQMMGAAMGMQPQATAVGTVAPAPYQVPVPSGPVAPGKAADPLPLISEVVELIPGVRARCLYRVAPEQLYDHHALGRDVSTENPDLTGLAIIPLTVSVEILAEAAALLHPGKVLVEMRKMRSQRWVMIEPPYPVLEMTAEQIEPGVVHVRMREAIEGKAIRPVWIEATAVFGDAYPAAPPPLPFHLEDSRPSQWVEGTMYPWGLFHGPQLRGVIRVEKIGSNGATATLEVLPQDRLLRATPEPRFMLDPLMLDAVGQLSGFWLQEAIDPHCDLFPYGFERLQCFAAMPPAGTRVEGRLLITEVSARDLRCDLEVLDPSGRPLMRVDEWTDRRFEQTGALWDYRVSPRDGAMTTSGAELLGDGSSPHVFCSKFAHFPTASLEASFGVWRKMLAYLSIGPAERVFWLSLSEARQPEWLLSRMAAKDAVRTLVNRQFGVKLHPADVGVLSDAQGCLRVTGGWTTRLGLSPVLSIASCPGLTVALASLDPGRLIGIDAASLTATPAPNETTLLPEERVWFESLPPNARAEWLLRVSCAKNAVGKALWRSETPGQDSFMAVKIDPRTGDIGIAIYGSSAAVFAAHASTVFPVHTMREDSVICATLVY